MWFIRCFQCILLVFFLLLPSFALGGESLKLYRAELDLTFAPPHNEPVVSPYVARYRLRGIGEIEWWRFHLGANLTFWGLNTWQHPSVMGRGTASWQDANWGIEQVRLDYRYWVGFFLDPKNRVSLFMEHGNWIYLTDYDERQGYQYYYLWGVRLKWE